MGEYLCPLRKELKPSTHDRLHIDWVSYVCPILREEIILAAERENWKRLKKLIKMGEDSGQIKLNTPANSGETL